jgi:hypothetical protein
MFELLMIFGPPLAVGFAAGFALRAHLSKRKRRLAKKYAWKPVPSAHR